MLLYFTEEKVSQAVGVNLRVLMFTQKVDENDLILGFTVRRIKELGKKVEELFVISSEIVENDVTGLLVEPNNKEEIKEAINRILRDNELRNNLVRNAIDRTKVFSLEVMVDKTLGVLEECAGKNFVDYICK